MDMPHRTGTFTGSGGIPIFWRHWAPVRPAGAAPLAILHGAFEDSGKYLHVAEFFARRGHPVWAMDHRGHGRSGGRRMYIRRFREYLDDVDLFVAMVTRAEGRRPVLVGHSMGGLIALRYALDRAGALAALVVSSPWVRTRVRIPLPLRLAAPVLSLLLPGLPVPAGPTGTLFRDPGLMARYAAYRDQPAVSTPRWFTECLRAQRELLRRAPALHLPFLMVQAGDDSLVDPDASRLVYERAGAADKTYRLFPGRYHELFNDIGYPEVLATVGEWLAARGLAATGTGQAP